MVVLANLRICWVKWVAILWHLLHCIGSSHMITASYLFTGCVDSSVEGLSVVSIGFCIKDLCL